MKKWLFMVGLLMLGTSQASTGVSCLLKTQLTRLIEQPFAQTIAHVNVQEAKDDAQARNDTSCSQTFGTGTRLLIDISPTNVKFDEKNPPQYRKGKILYFQFTYVGGLSSDGISMDRQYEMISEKEYRLQSKR